MISLFPFYMVEESRRFFHPQNVLTYSQSLPVKEKEANGSFESIGNLGWMGFFRAIYMIEQAKAVPDLT